jgi:hypothetical protein
MAGVLLSGSAALGAPADGIFGGVTNGNLVVIESWAAGTAKRLASFDLASLPASLPRTAIAAWNMLRIRLTPETRTVEVWFNPTHADVSGVGRGLRLSTKVSAVDLGSLLSSTKGATPRAYAAVRGGASMQVDYVGVFDGRDLG